MNAGKTVIITGASQGLGLEFAKFFAKDGYDLTLVARSKEKLDSASKDLSKNFGIKVKTFSSDLSKTGSVEKLWLELKKEKISPDILVNNAGFGLHGFFYETSLEKELEMMQLNMVSLTHLTKLVLQDMLKKGNGRILNISSTAAFQPGPLMAVYYASKAYVLFFSQALSNELKGTGITVTCLCPGPTRTGFQERAGLGGISLLRSNVMNANKAAEIGYNALMKGKTLEIAGFQNSLMAFMVRFLPRSLVLSHVRGLQEKTTLP